MKKRLLLTCLVLGTLISPWSSAQGLSLDEAEKKVSKVYGGNILGARTDEYQGVYVISVLLKDKSVRVVHVDINSGNLVE